MKYCATKVNPDRYKLDEALNDYSNNSGELSWTICRNALPGNILLITSSGNHAGIYAKAKVLSKPTLEFPDDEYWIDLNDTSRSIRTWMATITPLEVLTPSILEGELRQFPDLVPFAKWLHIQGKNRYISDNETSALKRLLRTRASNKP